MHSAMIPTLPMLYYGWLFTVCERKRLMVWDSLARLILLVLMGGIFVWTARALATGQILRAGCWFGMFLAVWMALLGGVVLIAPDAQPVGVVILVAAGIALVIQAMMWSEEWGLLPRLARFIETWPARWAGYPPPRRKRKRKPKPKHWIGGL